MVKEKEPDRESETVVSTIAHFIRTRTEAGHLASAGEIFEALTAKNFLKSSRQDPSRPFETLLKRALAENSDLREVSGAKGGTNYYSSQSMSEPYAAILARQGENPALLMAEVIRENSQKYPRPVPLGLFEGPPFSLKPDEILSCLKAMADSKDYQDIAQTTSSVGTVFLFSRLYLEPGYASMLAEWIDVGQASSP